MSSLSRSIPRNKEIRWLCGAQFSSLTATYALYFASMALVEDMTHSSTQMGVMLFSSTLPGLLFGLIAGIVVDRQERVGVVVTCNAARALVAFGFLSAVHLLPLHWLLITIYLTNFTLSALTQFVISAEAATLPRFATGEELLSANSLFNLSSLAAQGAGLVVLAPLLLKLGGAQGVAFVAAFLYLCALWMIGCVPRGEAYGLGKGDRTFGGIWRDLRRGWSLIRYDHALWLVTLQLTLISTVTLVLAMLAPGLVSREMGMRVEDAAYAAVPTGVGFGLGLALIGRRGGHCDKQSWINAGLISVAVSLGTFPLLKGLRGVSTLVFLGASLCLGAGLALVLIPAKTLLQERPPASMRGRVISTQLVLSNASTTLPMPLIGGVADLIGVRRVILLLALAVLWAAVASIRQGHG